MKIKKVISGYDIQLTLTWEEAQVLATVCTGIGGDPHGNSPRAAIDRLGDMLESVGIDSEWGSYPFHGSIMFDDPKSPKNK